MREQNDWVKLPHLLLGLGLPVWSVYNLAVLGLPAEWWGYLIAGFAPLLYLWANWSWLTQWKPWVVSIVGFAVFILGVLYPLDGVAGWMWYFPPILLWVIALAVWRVEP